MTVPTPPIELTGTASRLTAPTRQPDDELIARLRDICETLTADIGHRRGEPRLVAVGHALVARRKRSAAGRRGVPADHTAAGRRGAVGLFRAQACRSRPQVDAAACRGLRFRCSAVSCSTSPRCRASSTSTPCRAWSKCGQARSGPISRPSLRQRCAMTIGHFPQSFDIATVGGWVACRGAGQYSTRYGKIDADGGRPRGRAGRRHGAAHRPRSGGGDGSRPHPPLPRQRGHARCHHHGCWLRAHPVPTHERRAAYTFADFESGIEACRLILRRGATPAVLRLYDAVGDAARPRRRRRRSACCWCSTRATSASSRRRSASSKTNVRRRCRSPTTSSTSG